MAKPQRGRSAILVAFCAALIGAMAPELLVDPAPDVAHALECPAASTPAVHDWPGGERVLSCRTCADNGSCVPHGPGEQWWGARPVRLWQGQWQDGRKQGEWVFSTYAGREFLRIDFEDDLPAGAPVPSCPGDRVPASTHVWPGGSDLPLPEDVEFWIHCRDPDAVHPVYRTLVDFLRGPRFEGPVLHWNPHSRRVTAELEYVDGEAEGALERYHWNGQLWMRGVLRDGRLDGRIHRWHPNGVLSQAIGFENGKSEGEGRTYYDTGVLRWVWNYREGKKHGWQWRFHPTGAPRSKELFENGEPVGPYFRWYDDGTLSYESDTRDAGPGTAISYHRGGAISMLWVYGVGDEPGLVLYGSPDGRWVPDTEAGCRAQAGSWQTYPGCWGGTNTVCELPSPEVHARCAALGECEPACRIDPAAARVVCPPG